MSDEGPSLTNLLAQDDDAPEEKAPRGEVPPQPGVPIEDIARTRTRSNEEIIREELRAAGVSYLNVWRTGVALLPTLLIAISFLRREVFEQMAKADPALKLLPLDRYLLGTALLFVVAYIFANLSVHLANRWRWYAEELPKACANPIGIPPNSPNRIAGLLFREVFYVFPAFDIFARFVLEAEVRGLWEHVGKMIGA